MSPQQKTLDKSIDYLGTIGAKLRDLQGFATLAHELIQNADDSKKADGDWASCMSIDVTKDALVVENDGFFSDCGQGDEKNCVWETNPEKEYKCDFHRFRSVAGGDKRRQSETSGAFGIGFISVYQITDLPELVSNGRHWTVDEVKDERNRVNQCGGCAKCQMSGLPGTRFILPWAMDPESALRKELRAQALTPKDVTKVLAAFKEALPAALIFLRHINQIELKHNGETVFRLERVVEGDSLILSDGTSDTIWHLLKGDFEPDAEALREKYGEHIESKRLSDVTLAISSDDLKTGLLFAFLPTQHETGLQFHVNADFYPTNDRKRILFETDFQSEWNRAAIAAAARVLASNIDRLPELLGHSQLWRMIQSVFDVSERARQSGTNSEFSVFWEHLLPTIKRTRVVYAIDLAWHFPGDSLILGSPDEDAALPLLADLALPVVQSDLRPHFNLLRRNEIGVKLLDIPDIVTVLRNDGLDRRTPTAELPGYLKEKERQAVLWQDLSFLLKRNRKTGDQSEVERLLGECAIAPDRHKAFWPIASIYCYEESVVDLFDLLGSPVPFLDDRTDYPPELSDLSPSLTVWKAIEIIATFEKSEIENLAKVNRELPSRLLTWFDDEWDPDREPHLRPQIADLPIYPCATGLRPLPELSLPGDFSDPLGIAGILEMSKLERNRQFLVRLGVTELDFQEYATRHIPNAFSSQDLSVEKRRETVGLLAKKMGEVRDDDEVRRALLETNLVECEDGTFRRSGEVYFRLDDVSNVLGQDQAWARVPADRVGSLSQFYTWLGVARWPRYEDILERIRHLTSSPPDLPVVYAVQRIFRCLAEQCRKDEIVEERLNALRELRWLPSKESRTEWYLPNEVHAVFSEYLFSSQAHFLYVPRQDQADCRDFLENIGVKFYPTPLQIVNHLIAFSEGGQAVNKEVYTALNNAADHPAIARLRDRQVILLSDDRTYVKASQVYWGDHPFGRYRHQLGVELRKYNDFFEKLGVRESPDHTDAMEVLNSISAEYASENKKLEPEAHSVVMSCWNMLQQALQDETLESDELASLSEKKVVPNSQDLLLRPDWLYFEDRTDISDEFPELRLQSFIQRPPGAWRAMSAAGVRPLSKAVNTHLVECDDPTADNELLNALHEKRFLIRRVVQAEPYVDFDTLEHLRIRRTAQLRIQRTLRAFRKEWTAEPRTVPAYYHPEEAVLFYVPNKGQPPWTSIARELALILCPEAEPGQIAAGLRSVLSASSLDEARTILDELGFARIEEAEEGDSPEAAVVEELGGETAPEPVDMPIESDAELPSDASNQEEQLTEDGQISDVADAVKSLLGGISTTAAPAELDKPDYATGRGKSSGVAAPANANARHSDANRRARKKPGHAKLRTYVVPERNGPGPENGQQIAKERTAVERAGVGHVMAYERRHDRLPKEMSPNHEGYDIESAGKDGLVARFIEVKSLSGKWTFSNAGLTRPEFNKGIQLGDNFWLYVVERAEQEDFQIFPIQNPAGRANQFLFDDGWRALAEEDTCPAESASPTKETHGED